MRRRQCPQGPVNVLDKPEQVGQVGLGVELTGADQGLLDRLLRIVDRFPDGVILRIGAVQVQPALIIFVAVVTHGRSAFARCWRLIRDSWQKSNSSQLLDRQIKLRCDFGVGFINGRHRAEQARRNRAQSSPIPEEKSEPQIEVCPRCGGTETLNYLVDSDGHAEIIPPHIPPSKVLYEHPGTYIASETCSYLLEKQRQARLAKLMDGGGVPRLYHNMTFDTWDAQPPASRTGKEEARYYAELFANGQLVVDGCERFGLVLSGAVGRGKTGLASYVFTARARRNETVLWVDFSKFIRKIRDTYHTGSENSYEQVVGAAATVPFLLIDDMGDTDASKAISDEPAAQCL